MTVKECYERIGDYEEVIGRLGREDRICRYLGKLGGDRTFDDLCRAVEAGDVEQAFLCAHNLKGLYLNLSMTHAGQAASALCEALRAGDPDGRAPALLEALRGQHQTVLSTVDELLRTPQEGASQ
ncbi:MAG: Hpt domain-containing protein [Eubacteriales bacterium]|nr:Hpt domain-containing protein [Eubacteriales bacterium]